MGNRTDRVKGRGKEALGRLVHSKDLESEGKADRRDAEAAARVSHAKQQVEGLIDKAKDVPNRK
jgi:uncharacterized protein YjbJ (UPF0337 family)